MYRYKRVLKSFKVEEDSIWAYPKFERDNRIPQCGFKIHLSATTVNAEMVFEKAYKILNEKKVFYKVVASLEKLFMLNSGEYGYSQIGKFITIYPKSELEFIDIIELLYRNTLGLQGVDIPSDFRYKNSSIVFYRYGEFVENQSEFNDHRKREIPKKVCVPIEDFYLKRFTISPQDYYPITCLRTRGKSRVFWGIDIYNKVPIIMKEGLMLGEIDHEGFDGVSGIIQEKAILEALEDINIFPRVIDAYYLNSSFFLIEEYKNGKSLKQIIEDGDSHLLLSYKDLILNSVLDAFDELIKKKIIAGDISLDNIILDENGNVSMVDVEFYRFYGQKSRKMSGTKGFYCEDFNEKQLMLYSFFSLWYFLLFPDMYIELLKNEENSFQNCIEKYSEIWPQIETIIREKNISKALSDIRVILKRSTEE